LLHNLSPEKGNIQEFNLLAALQSRRKYMGMLSG
jgi:hypothetical protein